MRFDANGILKWDAAPPAGSLMEYLSSLVAHWELRRPPPLPLSSPVDFQVVVEKLQALDI